MRLSACVVVFGAVAGTVSACSGGDSTGTPEVSSIRFVKQPANVIAGVPFDVTVELLKSDGTRANASNQVSVSVTGGATLSGPTTVTASNGLATFAELTTTQVGTDFQLQASSGGLTVSSAVFAVAPNGPSLGQSSMVQFPIPIEVGQPFTTRMLFKDQFGNVLAGRSISVTANLSGSTFTPSSGSTGADGSFSTTFRSTTAGSASVTATVDGTAITFASPLIVGSCPAPLSFTLNSSAVGTMPAGCIIADAPTVSYRFTTAAASGVSFGVTSPFAAILQVTTDPPGDHVGFSVESGLTVEWLLPAGTFITRLRAQSGLGQYTLNGALVPANLGRTLRALIVGGTYTGQSFMADDFDFGDGSVFDVFVMYSPRACTITVRSAAVDAYAIILNASGSTVIAEDDDTGGGVNGTDAQISLSPCADATSPVLIIANHWPPLPSGGAPYTLELALAAAGPGASTADASTTITHLRIPADLPLGRAIRAAIARKQKSR
jgi:hypothetical protein